MKQLTKTVFAVPIFKEDSNANWKPNPTGRKSEDGIIEIIGLYSQITEEQASEIVYGWNVPTGGDDYQDYYKNYEIETDADYLHKRHFTNPKDSLFTLMQAKECYLENPYGKEEPEEPDFENKTMP